MKQLKQMIQPLLEKTWIKQIIKFAIVGGLGTITNLILFFILVDLNQINEDMAIVFCFILAASQNYMFNEKWTFIYNRENHFKKTRYLKFLVLSSIALLANRYIFHFLQDTFGFSYKVIPQAMSILCAMIINFLASKFITFK